MGQMKLTLFITGQCEWERVLHLPDFLFFIKRQVNEWTIFDDDEYKIKMFRHTWCTFYIRLEFHTPDLLSISFISCFVFASLFLGHFDIFKSNVTKPPLELVKEKSQQGEKENKKVKQSNQFGISYIRFLGSIRFHDCLCFFWNKSLDSILLVFEVWHFQWNSIKDHFECLMWKIGKWKKTPPVWRTYHIMWNKQTFSWFPNQISSTRQKWTEKKNGKNHSNRISFN